MEDAAGQYAARGPGALDVTDSGHVLMAVALDRPVKYGDDGVVIRYRGYDLVPVSTHDTTVLPAERAGNFAVSYDPDSLTITVTVDAETLFRFSVAAPAAGETLVVAEDGVPLIAGVQIAAYHFRSAAASGADEDVNAPGGSEISRFNGLLAQIARIAQADAEAKSATGERGATQFPECRDCTAGGPGSTGCGIDGCTQSPHSCSVTCQKAEYYACCKCLPSPNQYASCRCCKVEQQPGGSPDD
jgi:hypothetical protein